MKCPKCSYISFDYNLSCPKCNKDISSEQEKLHIPPFRPDPPFLLTALTGELNESQMGAAPTASQIPFDTDADANLDDSGALDSGEIALDDSSELNLDSDELSLDDTSALTLDTGDVQTEVAEGLKRLRSDTDGADGGEFKLEPAADLGDFDLGEEGEEEFSLDSGEKPEKPSAKEATDSEMDITLDLEEGEVSGSTLSADLSSTTDMQATIPKLQSLDLETKEKQGKEEIELNLDDLNINDTGELELGSPSKTLGDLDKLIEMDEIKLDEIPFKDALQKSKREARVVSAAVPKKKPAEKSADDELSLDLEDLDVELELEDAKPH